MPSKEDIREGVAQRLYWSAYIGGDWSTAVQQGLYRAKAKKVLGYLHSQGVVIKVERELTASICGYCEHLDSCQETHSECDRFKLEAGYEAVESLI